MQIRRPGRREPGSILSRVADRVRGRATDRMTDDGDHGPTCDGRCGGYPDRTTSVVLDGVPHLRVIRSEAGITTAEYAVGTAAGAGLAGLLYTMLTGGFGDQLLTTLFDHVLGLLGIG